MCDSVNHTRFPKEDHLPNWERRDNKVTKGDRVQWTTETYAYPTYTTRRVENVCVMSFSHRYHTNFYFASYFQSCVAPI